MALKSSLHLLVCLFLLFVLVLFFFLSRRTFSIHYWSRKSVHLYSPSSVNLQNLVHFPGIGMLGLQLCFLFFIYLFFGHYFLVA